MVMLVGPVELVEIRQPLVVAVELVQLEPMV
jgi:hypothetical protein